MKILIILGAFLFVHQSSSHPSMIILDQQLDVQADPTSAHAVATTAAGPSACDKCKVIVGDINMFVQWGGIISGAKMFCTMFHSNICLEVVKDIEIVFSSFKPYFSDPEWTCQKLNACTRGPLNPAIPMLINLADQFYSNDIANSNGNTTLCDECQKACGEVIAQLQDPAQQQNIKATFEEICDYVRPLKEKCVKSIDQMVPQLITWITSRFTDPKALCTQLHFCKSS